MSSQRYFPNRAADQVVWLENFSNKLPRYVVPLGLDPARVAEVIATCRFAVYAMGAWLTAARMFGPTATTAVDALLNGDGKATATLPGFNAPPMPEGVAPVATGVLNRVFSLAGFIKVTHGYNEVIGLDLGIVAHTAGAAAVAADVHGRPDVQLEITQGKLCQAVKIHFVKHGHLGVWIEGTRGKGLWEFVGVDTASPYLDERALLAPGVPEVREYRLRYWDKGKPNGDWTGVVTITVGP